VYLAPQQKKKKTKKKVKTHESAKERPKKKKETNKPTQPSLSKKEIRPVKTPVSYAPRSCDAHGAVSK
jgi:hypothetical protein